MAPAENHGRKCAEKMVAFLKFNVQRQAVCERREGCTWNESYGSTRRLCLSSRWPYKVISSIESVKGYRGAK